MRKAYEMTCAVNRGLQQQRQQEITEYLEEGKRVAVQEPITATMVVCIDAGKVPTRANESVDDAGTKSYECQYRDAKVATVSAIHKSKDADEPAAEDDDKDAQVRLTDTSCVTGIEHADAFFPRILPPHRGGDAAPQRSACGAAPGDHRRRRRMDLGPRL